MHLYYDNVNDAFLGLVKGFETGKFTIPDLKWGPPTAYAVNVKPSITRTSTRNGLVLTIDEPVTITYRNPRRRVLFNRGRDANPFFHMMEALWMLAGHNDIAPLLYYNKHVASFSDDGRTWHGAYGHRWRRYYGYDQLEAVIDVLTRQPDNRRTVLQMWFISDLERVRTMPECKDVPCNTQVMFKVRREANKNRKGDNTLTPNGYLDITVTNRSNDLVWGALGSNYVQFSMLQEYIANAIDVEVGLYHQISNNLHVYLPPDGSPPTQSNHFNPNEWQENPCNWYESTAARRDHNLYTTEYLPQRIYATPSQRKDFDLDCALLFSVPAEAHYHITGFRTPFFTNVIRHMVMAWGYHKQKDYFNAILSAGQISSEDWRVACTNWLKVRQHRYERAKDNGVQS